MCACVCVSECVCVHMCVYAACVHTEQGKVIEFLSIVKLDKLDNSLSVYLQTNFKP